MHILSMLDHKSRLKCIYWNAIYLVICVRIDCTHAWSWVAYFTGCGSTRPGGGGVGPALAHHRCCRPDVGPTLDWPESLSGRWRVAGRGCVWIALSIWTCKISLSLQKLSLSLLLFVTVPCQSTDFFVFKLSPALSALWTQHCSGGKKTTNIISYTFIPQRDW